MDEPSLELKRGCAIGQTGRKERKMIIYPCMYCKNGINYLYSMCNSMNVSVEAKEMNERLQRGETQYNGLSLVGIDYFYAGEPYKTDMSLYD